MRNIGNANAELDTVVRGAKCLHRGPPQAPDRFNPKVTVNTRGIIQKLYETRHIETMMFVKSVMGHFSKIEPKTLKKDIKKG